MRLNYLVLLIFLINSCISKEFKTHQINERQDLELINKGLLEIPDSVIKKSYRNIDISFNNISKLPGHWLIEQNILQSLTADFNNFSTLPLDSLPKNYVNSLSFQANQINGIPQSICSFDSLNAINLKENQVNIIPDCFWMLSNLTKVNLSYNNINSIYPSTNNSTIRELDLQSNKITGIGKEIFEFPDLEYLNLADNHIQKLPFDTIPHDMKSLIVTGNPIPDDEKNRIMKHNPDAYFIMW